MKSPMLNSANSLTASCGQPVRHLLLTGVLMLELTRTIREHEEGEAIRQSETEEVRTAEASRGKIPRLEIVDNRLS